MAKPEPVENTISVHGGTDNIHFLDTITFDTTIEKLKGNELPIIQLQAYQDVNGDGVVDTDMFGPDIVYAAPLIPPDGSIKLGDGTNEWVNRGGDAICTAQLRVDEQDGDVRILASTGEFTVYNP